MTRRILALFDIADHKQLERLTWYRSKSSIGHCERELTLVEVGIWLCPVDVPEDFPSEAMDHETFRVWATSAFNTGRTDVWAHWAKTVYRHLFCPLCDKHTYRVVCL